MSEPVLQSGIVAMERPLATVLGDRSTTRAVAATGVPATAEEILPDASWFVPFVEDIMITHGWTVGAAFQKRWKSGDANRRIGESFEGDRGPLGIEAISLAWIRGFPRAEAVCNELSRPDVFANEPARRRIRDALDSRIAHVNSGDVDFGGFPADGPPREDLYSNSRPVADRFDDLTAALGRFYLFVIPKGYAEVSESKVRVVVQQIGVYARDSFDFEGPQYLGFWQLPDKIGPAIVKEEPPMWRDRRARSDVFPMCNSAYNAWRDRTGKGEDFLIYSDIHAADVSHEFTFER